MASKKLRFVVLIALVLMLVLTFAACNLTQTTQQYKVTVHPNNGQVDVVWNRATNFPTLTREGYTMSGLYLDDTYTTAVTVEELKNMELTSDIDVYVKWTQNQTPQNYTVTVHPSNGGEDVIWQIGDAIPSFKKVGYVVGGFFVDENLEEPIDLSTLTELTSNMEVWVKWDDCKHSDSQWTIDDDATCTEDGKKHRTCPICEKLIEDTIPATDHAYGTVTYVWSADNATCTATRVCSHDASHKETETVNATAVVTQNKTCTLVELTTYTATFENAAFAQQVKEDVQTAAALDHAYGKVTYEWSKDNKTCTATRVCSHDASHKETETVNATAVVTQNKTCTLVELTTYTATFENAAFAQQVKVDVQTADALDHAYGTVTYEWSKDNKTCTATRVCSHDASHKETETVNATAVVTQNKTCTLVELTTYTATFENAAFAQQVKVYVQTADALGHNKTHHALDDANCTEYGTIEYWSCDRCNKNYSDEDCTKEVTELTISAKGHTLGDWIVETPATCTDAGVKAHKDCSVCKKHFDNDGNEIADLTISATGHDTTFHEKVDATCTTEGTLAYWSCDKCGKNFADQEGNTAITDLTIEKIAHTYGDWIDEVPAKCEETGTKGYQHCSVCDKNYDNEGNEIEDLTISALNHNYSEDWTIDVAADCTTDGSKSHHCLNSDCESKSDVTTIPAGHTYGELVKGVPAITKKDGTKTNGTKDHYHCSVCDKYFDSNKAEIAEADLVIVPTEDLFTSTINIAEYASANGWTNGSKNTVIEKEIVKIEVRDGGNNSGKYYSSGNNWRLYSSETPQLVFTAKENYVIVSVTITYKQDKNGVLTYGSKTIASDDRVQTVGEDFVFGASVGNVQITSITVGYDFTSDQAKAEALANTLVMDKDTFSADFDLPTVKGATVTWESGNTSIVNIVDGNAKVVQPDSDTTVTLTATITVGTASTTKDFNVTIIAGIMQYTVSFEAPSNVTIEVKNGDAIVSNGQKLDANTVLTIRLENTDAENLEIAKVLAGTTELTASEDGTYSFTLTADTAITVETRTLKGTSIEKAYTVEELWADYENLEDKAYSAMKVYVKGIVITAPTYNETYLSYTFDIKSSASGEKQVQGYSIKLADGVTVVYQNDEIVMYGYVQKFGSKLEITYKGSESGEIVSRQAGTSTVSFTENENASITVSPTSGLNGTAFTVTVTAHEGQEIKDVKVNGASVTLDEDGKYTGTIAGNMAIVVTTQAQGTGSEPTTGAEYSHTFANGDIRSGNNEWSNVSWTYTATGTYIGWDSNNGKGVQLGSGNSPVKTATLSTTGIQNFNTIIVNASMASSGDSKLAVYVGGTLIKEVSLTTSNAAYTFEVGSVSSAEIKIVYTNSKKAAYIKSIEVKKV